MFRELPAENYLEGATENSIKLQPKEQTRDRRRVKHTLTPLRVRNSFGKLKATIVVEQ